MRFFCIFIQIIKNTNSYYTPMPFDAKRLVILDQIDSTNNYAMEMVQLGELAHGDAVFALDQTAGKGRMGRTWRSERGANLILTLVVQMQWLPVVDQFRLSAAVSLGCRDFFQENIKENLKIKWPNDIYINDSKAGGILIENVIKGNLWQWAVIGIGLNLNQVHFESMDPPLFSACCIGLHFNPRLKDIMDQKVLAKLHS